MKKALLIVGLLSLFTTISAQTSEGLKQVGSSHNGIHVSAGYSVALGSHLVADQFKKQTGIASNGFEVQAGFDWMGKRNLGLAIQYTFQKNPLVATINAVNAGEVPDHYDPGAWTNHFVMAGPVFLTSLKKFYFEAKVLGGVVISSSTNFNTPDPTDTTGARHNQNTATGFAWQVSIGAGYTISSHFSFMFKVGLMEGLPSAHKQYGSQIVDYKTTKDPITGITSTKPIYSAPVSYEIKSTITTLTPSIGLVYRF